MSETEDENTFLTDKVRLGNSKSYHLYQKYRLHPRSTARRSGNEFERKCNASVAGSKTKARDELVEVPEDEIRENEDEYCSTCLRVEEEYDD